MKRRYMNEITFTVLLEDGDVFVFSVQDWDLDENEPLTREQALAMGESLVREDRVPLYGDLNGVPQRDGITLDPENVRQVSITHVRYSNA